MIEQIKKLSGCDLVAGQNGFIWIQGSTENELKVVRALQMVEEEAHLPGLTKKVENFLSGKKSGDKKSSKKESKKDSKKESEKDSGKEKKKTKAKAKAKKSSKKKK